VSHILVPHSTNAYNWTVPVGFECHARNGCRTVTYTADMHGAMLYSKGDSPNRNNKVLLPSYRHAYKSDKIPLHLYRNNFMSLQRKLGGGDHNGNLPFVLETGMACALERLWELSPTASQYQPDLFTKILPALRPSSEKYDNHDAIDSHDNIHDNNKLVLALYYRSGRTDQVAWEEEQGTAQKAITYRKEFLAMSQKQLRPFQRYMDCVLQTETLLIQQQQLGHYNKNYSQIVWLVVSDSPMFKQWVQDEYTTTHATTNLTTTTTTTAADIPSANTTTTIVRPVPRQVLSTTAKGTHTRTRRGPATTDFVEAMLDWYLLGLSDVVLTNGAQGAYTFGTMGAQRTHRPVVNADDRCQVLQMIHEDQVPPTLEDYQKRHQEEILQERDRFVKRNTAKHHQQQQQQQLLLHPQR